MVQAVEASLKRLNMDYIDLYWLHSWDATTPVEEVMRAFDDLVRAGKVLYIGVSNTPAWIVSQANTIAQLRGWTPFIGLQGQYSLMERTPERDLLPMAKAFNIGVTCWSPLAEGTLTGKYNNPSNEEVKRADNMEWMDVSDLDLTIPTEVVNIANEIGRTPAQVALNWLRQQPWKPIPLVGSRTLKQFKENIGCLEFELTSEQLERLDKVSAPDLGFPHDFLNSDMAQEGDFAGALAKIDM